MTGETSAEPPRWQYRLENYGRAYLLLSEAIALSRQRPLSKLEQEGVVQRFEYIWELAWKLMKDYLSAAGVVLETITPAATIRAAFTAKIISHGDPWMRALDARNRMSHTYSEKAFARVVNDIRDEYLDLFDAPYRDMRRRAEVEPDG